PLAASGRSRPPRRSRRRGPRPPVQGGIHLGGALSKEGEVPRKPKRESVRRRFPVTISRRGGYIRASTSFEGLQCAFKGATEDLDPVLARLADSEPGDKLLFFDRLFEALVMAQRRQSRRQPRGVQVDRAGLLATVKYAAAWLYRYARRDWPKRQLRPSHPA